MYSSLVLSNMFAFFSFKLFSFFFHSTNILSIYNSNWYFDKLYSFKSLYDIVDFGDGKSSLILFSFIVRFFNVKPTSSGNDTKKKMQKKVFLNF